MIIITVLSKNRIRLYGVLELKLYGIGSRNDGAVATAVGPRRASAKPANALTEARRRGRSFPKTHPTSFAYIVIDGCNFVKTVEDFYTNKGRAEIRSPQGFLLFSRHKAANQSSLCPFITREKANPRLSAALRHIIIRPRNISK